MKHTIIAYMSVLGMASAYAVNDDVVNSQMYVDNAVGNLQTNLPAKTSEKVVTYTTTAGTTGERDIKTTLGNETTNTSDNGIPTAGTVKTAVDGKQSKLNPLSDVNVVTYTGTTSNTNGWYGPGIVTTTPIYDSTVNTFDNGLVTAKTLNDAVIAGVNAEATKIQTPKGALWSFNRTAPKVLPTTANLNANIQGKMYCDKSQDGQNNNQNNCSEELYNGLQKGEWLVTYTSSDTVKGISVCAPVGSTYVAPGSVSEDQNNLTEIYNMWLNNNISNTGVTNRCSCKITSPIIGNPKWIVAGTLNPTDCAHRCANLCVFYARTNASFRGALFSASPLPAAE